MKDEIKEILDWLKDEDIYVEDYGFQYKRISLKEIKLLLDYITNLQQEIERKERLITQYGEGMCAYANRIDKAIEYIESYNLPEDLGHFGEAPISIRELRDLLNILQNGSDSQ